MIIDAIAQDGQLRALMQRLSSAKTGVVHATGLWGSSAPMATAHLAEKIRRTIFYITARPEEADDARDDVELFLKRACHLFPAWETLPGEGAASLEIEAERLDIQRLLTSPTGRSSQGLAPPVIIAPIQAVLQTLPRPELLQAHTLNFALDRPPRAQGTLTIDEVVAWLVDRGYERLDLIESPGDVARRGDIVDVFPVGDSSPIRIQFLDEAVERIRRFDVGTQRSGAEVPTFALTALPRGKLAASDVTGILSLLPKDSLIVLEEPAQVQEMGATLNARLGTSPYFRPVHEVLAATSFFSQLHLHNFAIEATEKDTFDFAVTSVARFEGSAVEAVAELSVLASDHHIHVYCDTEGERERLREILDAEPSATLRDIELHLGVLHRGFHWTRAKTMVLSHQELFQRHRQRRRIRRVHASRALDTWTDLKPGDHVVHLVHGIAAYRGLKKLQKGTSSQVEEFLTLEFADHAVVHVPVSQIDQVQQYIGAGGRKPHLSTLGGKRWNKTKQQVADSIAELADSLLRTQALRNERPGVAYPADTHWQREFEAAFPFEETEDQLIVAGEIRGDLMNARPMDRIVCGDVGYGKTELSMRAIFKVVEYGRQVAVLVPTTVLAEQHYETFRARMGEYPFSIGCLSRFRTAGEQKTMVENVKRGQVDIVIGTHRLLSKDVHFANLGLVVIDEEQRFGVEHKERLKHMRETVDVLTLTATPIPRTLHMSMIGVRDISTLQTPPVDRRSIATEVRPFDRQLIRDAILREMNRDGQVFFVHNFVYNIAEMADTVRQIVPEARVLFAHGQMGDTELEEVMHRFVRREADVLVTTTIIESGIDMPTVNTIFINRADRFGLADLHQLRGRVGRSSHRAYCYLLLSPGNAPVGRAAKRLKTIEEFSELGAGFRIAMRDLEIRGAGNLLGKEQSGHIAAVGYELYCRMLEQAIRRMKDEPDLAPAPVHIDLDVPAHVPPNYVPSDRSRLEIYRRMVSCRSTEELAQLERDLLDAFGPIPPPVARLLELTEIRVRAREADIVSISLRPPDVIFVLRSPAKAEGVFVGAAGTVRVPDEKTIHWRPPAAYLEPSTLVPVLRRMLARTHGAPVSNR